MANDYEIFELLKDTGRAFETSGPDETLEIIDFHILRDFSINDSNQKNYS